MKYFSIYLLLIALCIQCKPKNTLKDSNMIIKIKVITRIDCANNLEPGKEKNMYVIKINMINNTSEIISYWSWTCSWQTNWISLTDSLELLGQPECIKNILETVQISPKSEKELIGVVRVKGSINQISEKEFKLGFILIKKDELVNEPDYFNILEGKIKDKKDIILSEPFKLEN